MIIDVVWNAIVWIVLIIFAILQIILFFKLWRMTDDVSAILLHLENNRKDVKKKSLEISKDPDNNDPWGVGALVVEKGTGRQMRIKSIGKDGRFLCTVGLLDAGEFSRDEIIPFEQYIPNEKTEEGNNNILTVSIIIGILVLLFIVFIVASKS